MSNSIQSPDPKELVRLGEQVVERAKRLGADVAEAIVRESIELSTQIRKLEPELFEEARTRSIGLLMIRNGKVVSTSSSDLTEAGLGLLVGDAFELSNVTEPDPFAEPPEPSLLATTFPELSLFDPASLEIRAQAGKELAYQAEQAALTFDPQITNSDGATFSRTIAGVALVTSSGFAHGYLGSMHSLSVAPVADDRDQKKRRGSYWDSKRFFSDLESPREIGEEAARRTIAKLGAKKIETQEAPVIFSPDAGRALLSLLLSAVSGDAIYRKSSYLLEQEGHPVASSLITIVDNPLLPRGPGSRPFDGEGLPSRTNVVIEEGVLRTYLLDTYSAKKLARTSTGNASRGNGKPTVGASNFQLLPGTIEPGEIIGDVKHGLYVTSMMGFGFNVVTGDFSRGAEGHWIENGKLTKPVGEITISLNFRELWNSIDAVGNDLNLKSSLLCPTFRVKNMVIAGV